MFRRVQPKTSSDTNDGRALRVANQSCGGAPVKTVLTRGTALAALLAEFSLAAYAQPQAGKPNFVFILMDNLGYGEVGVYGGGVTRGAPTPRIDQLANQGLRLI